MCYYKWVYQGGIHEMSMEIFTRTTLAHQPKRLAVSGNEVLRIENAQPHIAIIIAFIIS